MRVHLGCIADDLTGATDLGGLLVRAGLDASMRIGVPAADATAQSPIEIVALKSRNMPPEDAVAQSRAALDWLRGQGVARAFFKYCSTFDSTPHGNIGPVAAALLADLGGAQTVYCPAFPENGRRVFMGNLFVGREPLAESPMRNHPLTPMRDSSLMRLLAPQLGEEPGLIDHPVVTRGAAAVREALAGAPRHVVADAVQDQDLTALAEGCRDLALTTGGSAFGAAVAVALARAGLPLAGGSRAGIGPVAGGQITLAGSCSAMTRKQVAHHAARAASFRLDPLTLAEHGPAAALDWLAGQAPDAPKLVYATAEPDEVAAAQARLGVDEAGRLVEEALAMVARQALAQGVRRFVVAGGETSGAVAAALGVSALAIGTEIVPGVPWTYGTSDGQPVALALKSGNFGAEDFFDRAHAMPEVAP